MFQYHYKQLAIALLLATLVTTPAFGNEQTSQDLAIIERTAIAFAKRSAPAGAEIQAQPLDRRLKLKQCSQKLIAFQLGQSNSAARRQTVGVRCAGSSPWKVYVSLHTETYVFVPVATKFLSAGHVLNAQDLKMQRRASSRLGSQVAHDLAELLGKKLRRAVHPEQAIAINTLTAEKLIKRGQHIDIIADLPGIRVRVAGIASSDGVANQRIWVKNLGSGQKIQAKVISENAVLATSL